MALGPSVEFGCFCFCDVAFIYVPAHQPGVALRRRSIPPSSRRPQADDVSRAQGYVLALGDHGQHGALPLEHEVRARRRPFAAAANARGWLLAWSPRSDALPLRPVKVNSNSVP